MGTSSATIGKSVDLDEYLPESVRSLVTTRQLDTTIPTIAKKPEVLADIAAALRRIPTHHHLHCGDARTVHFIDPESVHLVVTSPPYWTLKRYNESRPINWDTWMTTRSSLMPWMASGVGCSKRWYRGAESCVWSAMSVCHDGRTTVNIRVSLCILQFKNVAA